MVMRQLDTRFIDAACHTPSPKYLIDEKPVKYAYWVFHLIEVRPETAEVWHARLASRNDQPAAGY